MKLLQVLLLLLTANLASSKEALSNQDYGREFQGFTFIAEKLVNFHKEHGTFPEQIKALNLEEYKIFPHIKHVIESPDLIYNPKPSSNGSVLSFNGEKFSGKVMPDLTIATQKK